MDLTKQTQDVLTRIFKVYKKRIKDGKSIDESVEFSFNFQYNDEVLSKMNLITLNTLFENCKRQEP